MNTQKVTKPCACWMLLRLVLVAAMPTFGQQGADLIAWTIKSREANSEHGIRT